MPRFISKNSRGGFTLVESLLSLVITSFIVINIFSILSLLKNDRNIEQYQEDIFIAAKQISQYTNGKLIQEFGNTLSYYTEDNEFFEICLDKERVVKKPGFEILLFDIQELDFYKKETYIFMKVKRKNQTYDFLVTHYYEDIDETPQEEAEDNEE